MRWRWVRMLSVWLSIAAAQAQPAQALEIPVAGLVPWAPPEFRNSAPISTTPLLIEVADTAFLFPIAWFGERPSAYPPPWRFAAFTLEASLPPLRPLGPFDGHLDDGGRIPGRGIFVRINVIALPPKPAETFDAKQRRWLGGALEYRGHGADAYLTLKGLEPAMDGTFGLRALAPTRPATRPQTDGANPSASTERPRGDDVFFGESDGLVTTRIQCQPLQTPEQLARSGQIQSCEHSFHWGGMEINLQYHRSLLPDWVGMERRVGALLQAFRTAGEAALAEGRRPGPQR